MRGTDPVATVLVFEGQGAREIPDDPPLDLTVVEPLVAQTAIVRHQIERAATVARDGGIAIVGQSLGELSGLVVAGALDLDDALELVRLRVELPDRLLVPRRWAMASMTRLAPAAARTAGEGLEIWVAGENGPADTIVVGERDAFDELVARLAISPSTYRELPVVQPYHTPVMAPVAEAMGQELDQMDVRDPLVPVLSPTGPRWIRSAADVRDVVAGALVSPVSWSAALAMGADRWSTARWRECGPSASLHRFVWKNSLDLDWAEA